MLYQHCFSVSAVDYGRKGQDNHEGPKLNRTLRPLDSAHIHLLSNRICKKDIGLETNAVGVKMCSVTTTTQDEIITHAISLEVW